MRQTIRRIALFFCFTLSLAVLSNLAQTQTFTVLHTFTGGDGKFPDAPLTMDRAGNLYGTASEGGFSDGGTAFKLSRRNGSYTFSLLYDFYQYPTDAAVPNAVVLAPDGTLYGSSSAGGSGLEGTVFRLRPPASICASISCLWTETIVYSFQGDSDGCSPQDIVFNAAGDIVGATNDFNNCFHSGTVYQLTASGSGWTYNLLYTFPGNDGGGASPDSALIIDNAGNLYGTTAHTNLQQGSGTVYQLAPSGSGWVHNALYVFDGTTGAYPYGVILDRTGDLFGTTSEGGSNNGGTVYELSPVSGGWTFNSFFSFPRNSTPDVPLTMDSQGNLYGETYGGGAYGYGTVFKLTPSGDGWTYSDLHDFTNYSDGSGPNGQILLDENGNLYGTAQAGGNIYINQCLPGGCGTVWEITP